jgi:hypothetical protein
MSFVHPISFLLGPRRRLGSGRLFGDYTLGIGVLRPALLRAETYEQRRQREMQKELAEFNNSRARYQQQLELARYATARGIECAVQSSRSGA